MTRESYAKFYANEYRTLYGDNDMSKEKLFQLRVAQGKELCKIITRIIPIAKDSVVFDIGCDTGTMLIPFHDSGCKVMGVDYGTDDINLGKKMTGLNLQVGGIEKLKEYPEKADLIILNHVLEHFIDIDQELGLIKDVMKDSAYIYVSIPGTFWWIKNVCGYNTMGVLQNAHTWQFSLSTLTYIMNCCGFELVYGNEKIQSIFKKSSSAVRKLENTPKGEYKRVYGYLMRLELIKNIIVKLGLKKAALKSVMTFMKLKRRIIG
jgi:2-polyprenyl-3-methyl-5-hydroxy-6-metoxy-1,4-benzoquinol methylase